MNAKPRMNLFRELNATPKAAPRAPLKLNFHAKFALVLAVLIGAGMVRSKLEQKRHSLELRVNIDKLEKELSGILKQTEEIAVELHKRKDEAAARQTAVIKSAATGAAEQPVAKGLGAPLDGTWTAFLWRFSTLTTTMIMIDRMELKGGGPAKTGRSVSLAGSAKSLAVVRDWLDRLLNELPGWDFVMDSQAGGADKKFPVSFRITARAL